MSVRSLPPRGNPHSPNGSASLRSPRWPLPRAGAARPGRPRALRRATTSSTRATSTPRTSRGWPPTRTRAARRSWAARSRSRGAPTSRRRPTRRVSTRRSATRSSAPTPASWCRTPQSTDLTKAETRRPRRRGEHAHGQLRRPDVHLHAALGVDVEHDAAATGDRRRTSSAASCATAIRRLRRTATPGTTSRRSRASRRSAPRSRTPARRRAPPLARRSSTTA